MSDLDLWERRLGLTHTCFPRIWSYLGTSSSWIFGNFWKNVLRANWKVFKRKCFKKGISKKGNFLFRKVFKHLKNTIFKNFLFWKYLFWNISFLKPSNWPSKHFSKISKNPWVTHTQVQVTSDPWETSICESESPSHRSLMWVTWNDWDSWTALGREQIVGLSVDRLVFWYLTLSALKCSWPEWNSSSTGSPFFRR